jgi:NAD(P)-dependent dehydrogenase (short-subunit alcohol dehydrogenase family)
MAQEGAPIVIADTDLAGAERVKAQISSAGGRSLALQTDVSQVAHVDGMVRASLKEFGTVDVLVNNAGVYHPKPALEVTEADLDRTLAVNLKGAFFCTQRVARHMVERRSGAIINISSGLARLGSRDLVDYAASKGAIDAMTRSFARALAPYGIRVNAIAPGPTRTATMLRNRHPEYLEGLRKMIPLNRLGERDDYAGLCIFLASDESGFITGQVISVDGGATIP